MTSRPRPTRRSPEFRRRHRCSPQPGHRDLAVTRLAGPAKSAHHIDRFLLRLSRGQVTLPRIAAGIPVITIVTTGARTGQRRTTPLLGVPIGDDLAIIGTRFGQRGTPGWYYNIRASPAVEVAYRGKSVTATAREAGGEEWQDIWERAREIYAGYEIYARRIQDRQIHIIILSMQAGPAYRSRNDLPAGSAYPVRELADVGVAGLADRAQLRGRGGRGVYAGHDNPAPAGADRHRGFVSLKSALAAGPGAVTSTPTAGPPGRPSTVTPAARPGPGCRAPPAGQGRPSPAGNASSAGCSCRPAARRIDMFLTLVGSTDRHLRVSAGPAAADLSGALGTPSASGGDRCAYVRLYSWIAHMFPSRSSKKQ